MVKKSRVIAGQPRSLQTDIQSMSDEQHEVVEALLDTKSTILKHVLSEAELRLLEEPDMLQGELLDLDHQFARRGRSVQLHAQQTVPTSSSSRHFDRCAGERSREFAGHQDVCRNRNVTLGDWALHPLPYDRSHSYAEDLHVECLLGADVAGPVLLFGARRHVDHEGPSGHIFVHFTCPRDRGVLPESNGPRA